MEKYLMSSPQPQLSQPFDNDTLIQQLGYDYDQAVSSRQPEEFLGRTDTDEDEDDMVVPVSNNDNIDTSVNFNSFVHLDSINTNLMEVANHQGHSRNFSFDDDDDNNNTFLESKSYHQSTFSMVSINQDPPSGLSFPSLPQSTSTSTMYSMDSIPQQQHQTLTSSTSSQSLSDSPHHIHQQHPHLHPQHYPMATPRRVGRKKSISSVQPQFNTPLNPATQSPMVLSKITKTPHSSKPNRHTRSRSRVSVDLKNSANPFYTPSQQQQSFLSVTEDGGTPLLTPTASSKQSGRIRSSTSGSFFSPLNSNNTIPTLETIEIPEDDAFKQLRKARSFSSISRKRVVNQYPQPPPTTAPQQQQPSQSLLFAEDLSIRLENEINPDPEKLSTTSSTPGGVFYTGSNVNYETSISVPSSASSSTAPTTTLTTTNGSGIDLLSPQFDNSRPIPYPTQINKSFTRSSGGSLSSNSFIKSYPASIDLASTISNSHYQATNGGLLPPMATFTVHRKEEEEDSDDEEERHNYSSEDQSDDDITVTIPIPQDLQVTIPIVRNNRSEKNQDKVDPKKKHKCPICESRFQRPEHVKRHMKSHSSEKPFQCDEPNCGKRFNRKDNLKAHLKKIHGRHL
ncbi:Cell wall integrity transcriptional regulator CAS5 [Spathaspora sp. JA1]|nr:Cell wall integrity transcriptional regulator CAS5 [Spathaspora sp. JA1]